MSEKVQRMFSDISGDYDLLNDLLSFGRHRLWKKRFVSKIPMNDGGKHLDVATGTGDIAREVVRQSDGKVRVVGVDFSESMIIKAKYCKDCDWTNLEFQVGDATDLIFDSEYFDSVSISFGIRNIPGLVNAINEMSRVLKPGGILAIMEFGTPDAPFRWFYNFYSKTFMPFVGKIISGHSDAYTYLPETIKVFPYGANFKRILLDTGNFTDVRYEKMELGTVYAYYCVKK